MFRSFAGDNQQTADKVVGGGDNGDERGQLRPQVCRSAVPERGSVHSRPGRLHLQLSTPIRRWQLRVRWAIVCCRIRFRRQRQVTSSILEILESFLRFLRFKIQFSISWEPVPLRCMNSLQRSLMELWAFANSARCRTRAGMAFYKLHRLHNMLPVPRDVAKPSPCFPAGGMVIGHMGCICCMPCGCI